MEIIETERAYVKDLHEIIEGYLKQMKSNCQFINNNRDREDSFNAAIEPEVLTALFGNLEDVYKFSSHFLSQLDTCHLDPVSIAQTFVANSHEFDVYTQYCTVHYPQTLKLLSDLMSNPQTSQAFRERQLSLGHCLPLGAYLLKPVQRILKYPLLLHNIVKHCEETEEERMEGYESIKEALTVMTNYASHINDMKRKHEHQVRVQEVQSLLHGWHGQDLTTYGELLCESSFRVYGDRGVRYLFLFEKMLLVCKKKTEGNLYYKTHIDGSNLMLIESIHGQPLCFNVIPFDNPRVQYTFESRKIDEKRRWCLLLKKVILDNYHAVIPMQAKQALLELGQESPNRPTYERSKSSSLDSHSSSTLPLSLDKVSPCHLISRRKLSAPEYLEKRHQRTSPRVQNNNQQEVKEHPSRKAVDMIHASIHKGFRLRKSLRRIYSADSSVQRRLQRKTSLQSSPPNLSFEESNDTSPESSSNGESSPEEVTVKMRRRIGNTPSSKDGNEEDEGYLSINNRFSIISIDSRCDPSDILNMCPPPQTFVPKTPKQSISETTTEDIDDSSSVVEDYDRFTKGVRYRTSMLSRKTSSLSGTTVDSGVGGEGGSRRNLFTPLSSGSSSLSMASSNLSSDTESTYYSGCNQAYSNYYFGPSVRRVHSFNHHNSNNGSNAISSGNNCRYKGTLRQLTHTESFKHTSTAESRRRLLRSPKKTLSISATKVALSSKSLRNLEQDLSPVAVTLPSHSFVDETTACLNNLRHGISNLRMIDDDNDHPDVD